MTATDPPLLEIDGLVTSLVTDGVRVPLVDGVSFAVQSAETLAVVGESGCGKSLTALSILRLIDPPLEISAGSIRFEGRDVLALGPRELRAMRGRRVAIVFQEPMTALNPVLTVGDQVDEVLTTHLGMNRRDARRRTVDLFREVGIPDAAARADEYPHRLSGGLRQRVMIAMALAGDPALLIADEPTTALDVTIQAQILDLLRRIQRERGMALLLITHDLGVVAELADRVVVMYAGRVVEEAAAGALFDRPLHPYTRGLFRSVPHASASAEVDRLVAIPGQVPRPEALPSGCRFHPRCDESIDRCRAVDPRLVTIGPRRVACIVREEEAR